MRRKRKRRLDPAKVLWLLLALNLAVGFYASPLSSLTRLRAEGVVPEDWQWVRQTVQPLADQPFWRADRASVERRLAAASHVSSVRLEANLFGRALLQLRYHRPVASLAEAEGMYLSDKGVLYGSPRPIDGLPKLRLPSDAHRPGLSIVSPWPIARMAWLAQKLPKGIDPNAAVLEVESNGTLSILSGGGGRIRLGDAEDLEEKLRVVARLLDQQPDLLNKVEDLNVTSPQVPAIQPRRPAAPGGRK